MTVVDQGRGWRYNQNLPNTINEGSSFVRTCWLYWAPPVGGEVRLQVNSSDTTALQVTGGLKIFTSDSWDTPQTYTFSAPQDADVEDEVVEISWSWVEYDADDNQISTGSSGFNPRLITVIDDDTANLVFSASPTEVNENSTATFSFQLSHVPSGNVTISVTSDDTDTLTVDSGDASLTFTTSNWDTGQNVVVTGESVSDDTDVTVNFAGSGGGYGDVDVDKTVTVEDVPPPTLFSFFATPGSVNEGGTATYRVALNSPPSNTNTITAESGDTDALTVSPSSRTYTISNWNTPQDFTIAGVEDDDSDDEVDVALTFTVSSNSETRVFHVRVIDDEASGSEGEGEGASGSADEGAPAPSITVTEFPETIAAGSIATFKMALSERPSEAVTVTVCLLYTSPSPRDRTRSRMPSSA